MAAPSQNQQITGPLLVSAAEGVSGGFPTTGILVYVSGNDIRFVKQASGGKYAFRNTADSADRMTVDDSGNLVVAGNFSAVGEQVLTTADALTAAGTTRTDALVLTAEVNRITTAAAGSGVIIPASVAGTQIVVINSGASPLQVYAPGSDKINDLTNTVGVTMPANSVYVFFCPIANKWYVEGIGTGYSGSLQTLSFSLGLTAAGTNQATALLLASMVNRFTTVANSTVVGALLPVNTPGMQVVVVNDGANALQVFPDTGAAINSLPTNTATLLPVGQSATFVCVAANVWKTAVVNPREVNTAISTAGAGTLTAAAIVGGVITRTGPTSAVNDTVDTAANIIAALHGASAGQSWEMVVKNTTAFAITIVTATGVTLSGQVIIPPNSVGRFLVTVASGTTVTIQGLSLSPMTTSPLEAVTAINTVGAGTLTAAAIAGGFITRGGGQSGSAFSDATGTGAAIIAALPNANVGQSFELTILNNTNAQETITAGDGNVTLSGITIIPLNSWVKFLVTVATATTVTIQGMAMGQFATLPASQYTTLSGNATLALTGAQFAGAEVVHINLTGTAGSVTSPTAANLLAAIPNVQVGRTYRLRISATTGTWTLSGGDGNVTITGTATVAINTWREWIVTIASATTVTLQNVGAGTI